MPGVRVTGSLFISGSIAAAWRLAIFDKDWLVHSRNRGLSATVSTCLCLDPSLCFLKSRPLLKSETDKESPARHKSAVLTLPPAKLPPKGSDRNNRGMCALKTLTNKSLIQRGIVVF